MVENLEDRLSRDVSHYQVEHSDNSRIFFVGNSIKNMLLVLITISLIRHFLISTHRYDFMEKY